MRKSELEKIIIEETKELTADALNDVLDFIQFLKTNQAKKYRRKSYEKKINHELIDLGKASLIHLEEELANYRERYPPHSAR